MIVVAIIGILAAIAIPAYQDYTIRAQVTEGLNLMSDMKAGVAEYFAQEGVWPATEVTIGISTGAKSGKYVQSIAIANGTVTTTYGRQRTRTSRAAPCRCADGQLEQRRDLGLR